MSVRMRAYVFLGLRVLSSMFAHLTLFFTFLVFELTKDNEIRGQNILFEKPEKLIVVCSLHFNKNVESAKDLVSVVQHDMSCFIKKLIKLLCYLL